jgi:hypothetical protein
VIYRRKVQTLIPEERRPIEERVKLLLKAAGVKGPPTPTQSIVDCAQMVHVGEIDLEDFRESLVQRGLRRLLNLADVSQLWRKVKGFFRYDDRVFYVDPTLHPHQKNHHTFHEAYHAIDPAHEIVSEVIHLDTAQTLSPWAKRKMEREANLGASLIRFQVDQLQKEACDLPNSWETVCYLAGKFESSIHGALRHYVEYHVDACVMLVFNPIADVTISGEPYYTLRYYLPSPRFESRFESSWPERLYPDDKLFSIVNSARPNQPSCDEIVLADLSGNRVVCVAQGFHNHYDILILVFPKPSTQPRKRLLFNITTDRTNAPTKLTR